MLQGSRDDVVEEQSVAELVERLYQQKGITIDYRVLEGANHFFHGYNDILIDHVHDHLNKAGAGREVHIGSREEVMAG